MVSTLVIHVNTWITTNLLTPEGWKAELAWLVDSQRTLYPQSGLTPSTDQVYIRESPPARDRRSNHWAMRPTMWLNNVTQWSGTRLPGHSDTSAPRSPAENTLTGEKIARSDAPVHFRQQLVDGLIGVWMNLRARSLGSDCVDLVNENNARSSQLGRICTRQYQ